MIIVMKRDATERQIQAVIDRLVSQDLDVHRSTGAERTILGVVGSHLAEVGDLERFAGVKEVIRITKTCDEGDR